MKPLHPILVHFPIALTVFAVAADCAGLWMSNRSLAGAGGWAMVAAGAAALVTGAAGYLDMQRLHRVDGIDHAAHGRVHRHMFVGIAVVLVLAALAVWRGLLLWRGATPPMLYIDAGLVTVALVALQGFLGGELVYGDGVFVKVGAGDGKAPAAAATTTSAHDGH